MKVDGAWLPVGGVREVVWTGPSAPADPEIDLWVDTDEAGIGGVAPASGTSRINFNSTTELRLEVGVIPLLVGGMWTQRPISVSPTVTNAGLNANTPYFVYARDNNGATALEFSTTGRATDATFGVPIKQGDATRTCVGLLRTNPSANTFDGGLAISMFSRRPRVQIAKGIADTTVTTATWTSIAIALGVAWFGDDMGVQAVTSGWIGSGPAVTIGMRVIPVSNTLAGWLGADAAHTTVSANSGWWQNLSTVGRGFAANDGFWAVQEDVWIGGGSSFTFAAGPTALTVTYSG